MLFDLDKKSGRFEILNNRFSCFVSVHSLIFTAIIINPCVSVQHDDHFEIMTYTNLKIVGIMTRRDLDTAGSEVLIDIFIGDNRYFAPDKRQNKVLPYY
ncbi:hypothetical protein SDC9_166802 [bioreactor metagenome]|uniref:Uncharacterized protein n=1 Tax=bioreactor metagenome TaxID=1076179 RepID=A0A645G683_9ZZZZ